MSLITIIGRGHSGTRAMSHTLTASGVFMGEPLNVSGDLLPPQAMYDACRVLARHVRWLGGGSGSLAWDWSALHTMPIPAEFTTLIESYLKTVLARDTGGQPESEIRNPESEIRNWNGWKIPETTLAYPWITRMFPEIKYIFWIRNPRDCILGRHATDDMRKFGIQYPPTDDPLKQRAISWKYQYDLVKATPQPKHWIEVRFEDFVLRQDETLARLSQFLGIKLAKIAVKPEAVGRWQADTGVNYFDFFEPAMREYGYEIPDAMSPKGGSVLPGAQAPGRLA